MIRTLAKYCFHYQLNDQSKGGRTASVPHLDPPPSCFHWLRWESDQLALQSHMEGSHAGCAFLLGFLEENSLPRRGINRGRL